MKKIVIFSEQNTKVVHQFYFMYRKNQVCKNEQILLRKFYTFCGTSTLSGAKNIADYDSRHQNHEYCYKHTR